MDAVLRSRELLAIAKGVDVLDPGTEAQAAYQEYLRLIRPHLKPGGVYYFNTTYSPAVIRTAMTEHPHEVRVLNFASVSD